MTRDLTAAIPESWAPLLRWTLRRHTSAITCQLDVRGAHAYEVAVVPHEDPSAAVIERYDASLPALLRHAEITRRFREGGWTVIDHIVPGPVRDNA